MINSIIRYIQETVLVSVGIVHSKRIVRHAMMSCVADGEYGPGKRFRVQVHAQSRRGYEQLVHIWPTPRHRCSPRHWQLVPEDYMSGIWINMQYL